jgi:hypothetical protein
MFLHALSSCCILYYFGISGLLNTRHHDLSSAAICFVRYSAEIADVESYHYLSWHTLFSLIMTKKCIYSAIYICMLDNVSSSILVLFKDVLSDLTCVPEYLQKTKC